MNKYEMMKELLHIICFHCVETPNELCNQICDECLANAILNAGYCKVDIKVVNEKE